MVSKYFSLIKFSHTIFALPFALIGFFLAINLFKHEFNYWLFALVLLCMIFARSAAMGFNRYIDRKYDVKNPRTSMREIPSGIIHPNSALIFVIANCILFICTTFFINHLVLFLSPIALAVVLGYSYTKRFTWLCHVILGIGLSLAPIGAFLAVTGEFHIIPIIYSFVVLLWVGGFDIIYALQDEEFDKSENLKSIPAFFGKKNALLISIIFHFISALLVIIAGLLLGTLINFLYWIGSAIFIGLLIYQHLLVKPNDLSKVNLAFATTNGIASVIFALFVILSFYLKL